MASVDDFDWIEAMKVNALPYRDLFKTGRFPNEWVENTCRQAAFKCFSETNAARRLDSGDLDPSSFEYVCCSMVLRIIRYKMVESESNGSYDYTLKDDQSNPPGYDASPNLYLSSSERSLLDGGTSKRGRFGCVGMGVNRIYGM